MSDDTPRDPSDDHPRDPKSGNKPHAPDGDDESLDFSMAHSTGHQNSDTGQQSSEAMKMSHGHQSTHSSDHPGRDYPDEGSREREHFDDHADRIHSSGFSSPSEPRRPGTGERQAPRHPASEVTEAASIIPGEVLLGESDVVINDGLPVTTLRVSNTADRPVQVGSHFHFAEVNLALDFDREEAWGKRLNVLSGGAVRFEPGVVAEVELIPIRGSRIVRGLRGQCKGALDG